MPIVPINSRESARQNGAGAGKIGKGDHHRVAFEVRSPRANILDMRELFRPFDPAERAFRVRAKRAGSRVDVAARHVVNDCTEGVSVVEIQHAELGFAQARGIAKDRVEHGLQIAGRIRDDAQHLGRGRLCLRECLRLCVCGSRTRATRDLAFVPLERSLRPRVRLFAPLRDKLTSAACRSTGLPGPLHLKP
jgi:hypothetical protein